MNLLTATGRWPVLAAAGAPEEKADDSHPLGVPKRVIAERAAAAAAEQKQRENAAAEAFRRGNWKGAGGEQRSLEEEAKRAVGGKKATLDPWRLPSTLEELDATEWWNQGDNRERLVSLRGGCNCCFSPPCFNCTEPITQGEAERLGLIECVEGDGTCCVLSEDDLYNAWERAVAAKAGNCLLSVDRVLGRSWRGFWSDIPADKRAAVIAALNALEA